MTTMPDYCIVYTYMSQFTYKLLSLDSFISKGETSLFTKIML